MLISATRVKVCLVKLRCKHESGFSLLELVIVVAVVLIVSAMALPSIFNVIYDIRLRSAAQTVVGMMQTCRMQAARDNTFYFLRTRRIGSATWVWVSKSRTSYAPVAGEPQAILGSGILTSKTPPSQPSVDYNVVPFSLHQVPTFGARGLPCIVTSGSCQTSYSSGGASLAVGWQLYFADSRPNDWVAVMVSPAGRVQIFRYDGSNWHQ